MKTKRRLTRQAWLLFSDLNTRFNILIDECAHLQDTIFGHLENVRPEELSKDSLQCSLDRPWLPEEVIDEEVYGTYSTRERAFLNLWMSLGSLAHGLEENQSQCRVRFEDLVGTLEGNEEDNGKFYWFASQRAYFLGTAFQFYTNQIEHAHEKLVQMLENSPGALPHPILFRRWNSAAFGEFLSTYSRHVNWETHVAVWAMMHGTASFDLHAFGKDHARTFLTHSWSHIPTSRTRSHRLDPRKTRASGSPPETLSFGTVRSAYFYLEQPILFPLLYHECAHLNFPNSRPADGHGVGAGQAARSFFDAKHEAADTLQSLAQFEFADLSFWNHFTEEIWSDAIAIAVGGKAYLAALTFQLFGLSGGLAYSQYELPRDQLIPLGELGTASRQRREVPWPETDDWYFWEARLKLAILVYKDLYGTADSETNEWRESLECAIDHWVESGKSVFHKQGSSSEHEVYWRYKEKLNAWVTNVCRSCLEPFVQKLKTLTNLDNVYMLEEEKLLTTIDAAVNNYRKSIFEGHEQTPFRLARPTRLEQITIDVRWYFSDIVADCLAAALNASGNNLKTITQVYASYLRNDGSSAFRLGLEWCLARDSIYELAADLMLERTKSTGRDDPIEPLARAVDKDLSVWLEGLDKESTRRKKREIAVWLRKKKHLTNGIDGEIASSNYNLVAIHTFANERLNALTDVFKTQSLSNTQVQVGTLSLGVIRPWEIARMRPSSGDGPIKDSPSLATRESPYIFAMRSTREYFKNYEARLDELTRAYPNAAFKDQFFPLIGDYSFVWFLAGHTPVERDCHPVGLPKLLVKPRLVLKVYGAKEAGSTKSERRLGRLSLLRFRYRWEWLGLVRLLEKYEGSFGNATLYLSSAWEDAILITFHESESDYWDSFLKLRTHITTDRVDVQSSVIIPTLLEPTPVETLEFDGPARDRGWIEILCDARLGKEKIVKYLNERTGRYDYTIVWGDGHKGCDVARYSRIVCALPTEFWGRIESFSTSFEKAVAPKEDSHNYQIVSHVLLKY